jgi:putative endonuclease
MPVDAEDAAAASPPKSWAGISMLTRPFPGVERPPDHHLQALARGRAGEEATASWYEANGYVVIARNWRTRAGEIDLLCVHPDRSQLVVCEVKARRTDHLGTPAEAVTPAKQARLRRLAAAYLLTSPVRFAEVRFDVACVLGTELSVIEGAF